MVYIFCTELLRQETGRRANEFAAGGWADIRDVGRRPGAGWHAAVGGGPQLDARAGRGHPLARRQLRPAGQRQAGVLARGLGPQQRAIDGHLLLAL